MNWFASKNSTKKPVRSRLGIEPLEDRRLMAAGITLDGATGQVIIEGSDLRDSVTVRYDNKGTAGLSDDQVIVSLTSGGQTIQQAFSFLRPGTVIEQVKGIVFYGHEGNDFFFNNTSLLSFAEGGAGNDMLIGGSGRDGLHGGAGDDLLDGRLGNDFLSGGDGHDIAIGGYGDDLIEGNAGNDILAGNIGNDTLDGGADNDQLDGNNGNDELRGGTGDDVLEGSAGNDKLHGELGDDKLYGQAGIDQLFGDAGNDLMYGGAGYDTLEGGTGNDSLLGDAGNDVLRGENGNDFLYGGGGSDALRGGNNDDVLFGGNGRDYLYGESGDDMLSGGYVIFKPGSGVYIPGKVSDWNYDYLYSGAGEDFFLKGDKKFFGWWWDKVKDESSQDEVQAKGWNWNLVALILGVPEVGRESDPPPSAGHGYDGPAT